MGSRFRLWRLIPAGFVQSGGKSGGKARARNLSRLPGAIGAKVMARANASLPMSGVSSHPRLERVSRNFSKLTHYPNRFLDVTESRGLTGQVNKPG